MSAFGITPLSSYSPYNDIMVLTELQKCRNQMNVAATTSSALLQHLWYLVKDLVGLSLLDDRIPYKMKADCETQKIRPKITNAGQKSKKHDTSALMPSSTKGRTMFFLCFERKLELRKRSKDSCRRIISLEKETSCIKIFRPEPKAREWWMMLLKLEWPFQRRIMRH